MKEYNQGKYIRGLELQCIEDKGKGKMNQQPTSEIIVEELRSKLKINELR